MMKNISLIFLVIGFIACKVPKHDGNADPISHAQWDALLQKHVRSDGLVDYKGFLSDSTALNEYLDLLSKYHPNDDNWSSDEQIAYWINAYNAFTIKLITDHYPVKSIKDIKSGIAFVNSVWDIKFINIESRTYDLNEIEHGILRRYFDEPRIHFAINCASISCPKLQRYAFTAEHLDAQLTATAKEFLADPDKNIIRSGDIHISPIFNWFRKDFVKNGNLINFLNQYSPIIINENAKVRNTEYDWALNDTQ